ncbi:unnamed protein product [Cylindrotheca closterium]|uniref:Uncharacterized protein n=1 Tax=Cylindrotheca closterium TaxID=2856 RepID=A0AAD2G8T4_9STRA|nr:unnamed protein product [Cylindrotheca closterium]
MMERDNVAPPFPEQRVSEQSQLSEESFEDDFVDQEDVLIPLKSEDGSQDGVPRINYASSVGSLSEAEISELSVGEVNLSFPTGDSDDESDADSRNLIDWEADADSQGDTDSHSSESNKASRVLVHRLSSLLEKGHDATENDDTEDELLLQSDYQNANIRTESPPTVPLGVPDYIWKSPESLKKKTIKVGSSKSTKSKAKKKVVTDDRIDEESLSDGSSFGNGSVHSVPQDQIQKQLIFPDARTPEQLSTPVEESVPLPDVVAIATPPQGGKKKLGKKQYLMDVSDEASGTVSRYNPMFYSSSKQGPLVDHSYRSKKEKLMAKKERKKVIREERERLQAFNKTMDFFAEKGLEGDGEEEGGDAWNEALPTAPTPPATPSAESEADTTSTEESSGSYDSLMFDDDFSIASMDSIEGVTKVKKSSRKKKGKKATGKKKSGKKKKIEKKRGRRVDYEPDDDEYVEPERPRISIEERVEAIFTNRELIYQSHADVEKDLPQEELKTRIKIKSKAARSRSRSGSVDPKTRDKLLRRKSSGTLGSGSDSRSKRSASSRSLKSFDMDYGEASPDVRTDSVGSNKSSGKGRPRPTRPKLGGTKARSNSLSALTSNTKAIRESVLEGLSDDELDGNRMSSSDHVQSRGRGKRSAREGLSKSDHGNSRRGTGLLSKSNHESGGGGRVPVMRGKRPDRLRPPSKSKSPSSMQRKKVDSSGMGRSLSKSPSVMQRRKLEAREESMRKFEEILGKQDQSKFPSNFKKKLDGLSQKRDKNNNKADAPSSSSRSSSKSPKRRFDRSESRSSSRSPSSIRQSSSKHSKDPDEDPLLTSPAAEKPKSSRRAKKFEAKLPMEPEEEGHHHNQHHHQHHPMEPAEVSDDDDDHHHHHHHHQDIEEEELKPESTTRRKKTIGKDGLKRTRSRSRDFLNDMVDKVEKVAKPLKSNMVEMVKDLKPLSNKLKSSNK